MKNSYNRVLILLSVLFFLSVGTGTAQSSSGYLWNDIQEESIISVNRLIKPDSYRTLQLDFSGIKTLLVNAPKEENINVQNSSFIISLPMPNGEFENFKIVESPIMAEELANRYPDIKTYLGQGIDDRTATIRFDYTQHGFHAMILSVNGAVFIDPYSQGNTDYYISYYKRDYSPTTSALSFTCNVLGQDSPTALEVAELVSSGIDTPSGDELRTYRLAVAATGEYTIFHGGTVAAGLAAIVVAINRVTGVYETEIAVRFELVANNDLIVYTNPSTDPYTNNNGFTMLGQNQSNIDAVIGSANYDVGHVFSTGGGGIASLAVICVNGSKARGVTGLPSPIGDPFYIDYVAHEMGHQFAGSHTFNGNAGSCSGGNRYGPTAYEPGSGSTIQAYAGICGSQNLQFRSDAYFHNISFVQMVNHTTNGSGNNCPVITPTGNSAPVVDAGPGGYTIPIETPFMLTGSATDPDGDELTYNWEEFDLGPAGHPNSPSGNAPIFRSFFATTEPYRIFPKLENLLNNTQTIGEILPTYTRNLTFRLTVRDNRAAGGGVDYDGMSMTVTSTAGPFLVVSPNTSLTWMGNTLQTIEWDVANTSVAPVNTTEVNILLSTDGGETWPITITSNTPNDGSEQVLIPNEATTEARIKVEAVGNVFFDISNEDFTIEDNPIPVELTLFTAIQVKDGIKLYWTTATETNNAGFSVERSRDNFSFNSISYVDGNGTTTEVNDYSFVDKDVTSGRFFYRLKQIDFDGTYTFSKTVETEVNVPDVFVLSQNYPNPFNPSTNIKFSLPVDSKIRIYLFNTLGEKLDVIAEGEFSVGYHELNFDASKLSNGVYYYTLSAQGNNGSSFVTTRKMVLLK
jgi:hypothetical protein